TDLGFELCRMDGIDAIVLRSFIKAGDMFATDAKVLDVNNKNLLKSASSKGEGVASILKSQIDELSTEISHGMGVPESGQWCVLLSAYGWFICGHQAYGADEIDPRITRITRIKESKSQKETSRRFKTRGRLLTNRINGLTDKPSSRFADFSLHLFDSCSRQFPIEVVLFNLKTGGFHLFG
ncbi:MAG: hypothetical protein ACE5OR_17190, partial [bacterium]